MMIDSEFHTITLPPTKDLFEKLTDSVAFETIASGRIGNHLVHVGDNGIPIVRTTTSYTIPAQNFADIHNQIVTSINDAIRDNGLVNVPEMNFNNALIEVYDRNYAKMGYHSDQCLDLASDSFIGLFSCYENPDDLPDQNMRKLIVKDKATNHEYEISLGHNSVVLFSLSTNTRFLHKIVLDPLPGLQADNRWLGITFRQSKTFIHFKDGLPYFPDGELLKLATEEQKSEFYKLRGQENKNLDFAYPKLSYTISLADTLTPNG